MIHVNALDFNVCRSEVYFDAQCSIKVLEFTNQ